MQNIDLRPSTVQRRKEENQQRVENTVVQVLMKSGEWGDYSRDRESVCRAFVAVQPDPNRFRLRDWLTGELLDEPRA